MAELGWLGVTIPEQYGGLGMTLADAVPIVESMGRYLMGSPFVATTLAAQALITSGSEAQKNQWLSEIASGAAASVGLTEEDGNWRLQEIAATATANGETLSLAGTKCFVLDAKQAQAIVVSVMFEGAARLVLIQADQVPSGALMREVVIDETRRSFTFKLDDISVCLLYTSDAADEE